MSNFKVQEILKEHSPNRQRMGNEPSNVNGEVGVIFVRNRNRNHNGAATNTNGHTEGKLTNDLTQAPIAPPEPTDVEDHPPTPRPPTPRDQRNEQLVFARHHVINNQKEPDTYKL